MRRTLVAGLAAAVLTGLAGCSGGVRTADPGDSSAPASEKASPSPTSLADADALATLSGGPLAIDVLSVQHVTDDMVIARYRLRNTTDDEIVELEEPNNFVDYWHWDFSFSRVFLLDLQNGRRYYPPKTGDKGTCLCTNTDKKWGLVPELKPGGKPLYAWAAYAVPSDVDHVAFQDMQLGFAGEVRVSAADAELPHVKDEPSPDELVRKGEGRTALSFRSDSAARHAHNKGDTVTVNVSSDVLFGFDSAKLSGKAGDQLDQVANRIKTEAEGPVTVTGYTDSKGSTSYNLKLSKKRAQAVEKALDKRLADDVTFNVSGKGEADPVAPNRKNGQDNPAGRKKNRRVEVSYTRAVQHHTTSPTPANDTTEPAHSESIGKPLAGSVEDTRGLRVQVTGLRRVARGALLTFTVTNTTSEELSADRWADPPDGYPGDVSDYHGGDVYWVNLKDSSGTKYWVVSSSDTRCVCAYNLVDYVEPGASRHEWALLAAPPPGTDAVDVHLSGYGTVHDVPISR